ncbi:MAG: ABC transporter ATP-binding protein [Thermoplasmatota archaeon]
MIDVRGVDFSYNGRGKVLDGIQLRVDQKDMLGILGPNGSGKTTLVGIMTGILKPDSGRVFFEGSDIHKLRRREIAENIAVVPQRSDLGFEYSVEEVVSMGRYPHMGRFSFGDPRGEKVVDRAMELTEVRDLREKKVNRLSGGERQRVMIARALAQEPLLLILDEPTKNLDIRHSLDIMKLLQEWNRRKGLGVVAVLHDLDLAARFCSKIALLKEGRLHSMGGLDEVLTETTIKEVFDVRTRLRRGRRTSIEVIE